MARPIEITDAISKVQAIERMQQNVRAVPDAVQQFQKELNEKLTDEQAKTAPPVPSGDRIILHGEEKEKEQRRENPDRERDSFEHRPERADDHSSPSGKISDNSSGHIDIRI